MANTRHVRSGVPYMPRSLLVGEAGYQDGLLPPSVVHTCNFSSSCPYLLCVTAKYIFTLIVKSVWKLPAILCMHMLPHTHPLLLASLFSHCFHIVFTLRPTLDATGAAAPAVSHLTYLRGRDCHSHQWQLLLGSIPAQHIINQQRPDCGVRLC